MLNLIAKWWQWLAILSFLGLLGGCMMRTNISYAAPAGATDKTISWDCSGEYRPAEAHELGRDLFAMWVRDITDGVNLVSVAVAGVPLFPLQVIGTPPTPAP